MKTNEIRFNAELDKDAFNSLFLGFNLKQEAMPLALEGKGFKLYTAWLFDSESKIIAASHADSGLYFTVLAPLDLEDCNLVIDFLVDHTGFSSPLRVPENELQQKFYED